MWPAGLVAHLNISRREICSEIWISFFRTGTLCQSLGCIFWKTWNRLETWISYIWRQTAFSTLNINSTLSHHLFDFVRPEWNMKNFYGSSHSGARKHVILFPGILFSHPLQEENVSLPVLLNVYEIMNFNLTAVSTDSPTPQHKKKSWKERIPEGWFHRPGTLLGRFGGTCVCRTPPQPANRIPRADDDDDEFLFLALFIHFVFCVVCVLKRMFSPRSNRKGYA